MAPRFNRVLPGFNVPVWLITAFPGQKETPELYLNKAGTTPKHYLNKPEQHRNTPKRTETGLNA